MDMIAEVPHRPEPNTTLGALKLDSMAGGKGANEAVAAARLGAAVKMIGRVKGDLFGIQLRSGLDQEGTKKMRTRPTNELSIRAAYRHIPLFFFFFFTSPFLLGLCTHEKDDPDTCRLYFYVSHGKHTCLYAFRLNL